MSSQDGVDVLLGNQRIAVMALAVPLGIALFIQQVNSLVDSFWVSGLGSDHMAAIGIVSPMYAALVGVGGGLGIGISASISRFIGKGEPSSANRIAAQGLILTAAISIVLTILLLVTARPLLMLIGAGDTIGLCMDYAIPIYAGSVFVVMSGVMSGMLRGEGAAKRSMYIQTAGAFINIVLDPILIYTFDMGVAGAAWATVIALAATSIIPFYWYLYKKDTFVKIEKKDFVKDKRARSDILAVGLPEMLELSLMYLFNIILNYFVIMCGGTDGVAIYTTAWKIVALGVVPAQAIGGALVSVCSAEYGMRRFDAIADAFRYSIRMTMLSMAGVAILIIASAMPIAMAFTVGEGAVHIRSELEHVLIIMALFTPFFALVYPGSSLMQALRKAGQAMMNTILRNIIITAMFAAIAFTIADVEWIWYMLFIGETFGGFMMLAHARSVLKDLLKREKRRLDDNNTC